jgi:ParB family chromosome partitioning protein
LLIPLSDILYDEQFNARGFITPQSVEELAESIRSVGKLIHRLIVRPWTGPPYHLVCGHRRYKALQLLKWKEVEVEVVELNEHDARIYNLQENLARSDLSPSQELAAIVALYGDDPDLKTVAKALGRSKHWVRQRLAIRRLHPLVRLDVDNGLLTAYDIHLLVQVPFDKQPLLAMQLKQAHRDGKSTQSVADKMGRTRRVRTRAQIQKMMAELMDIGVNPSGWKCLAWAAGTITAEELMKEDTNDS